jgi:antitoxin component YwqK of YwqJK toxin-antitoxin module
VKKILFLVLIILSISVVKIFNLKLVNLKSHSLSLAAFGYKYNNLPFTGIIYERSGALFVNHLIFVYNGLLHGPEIHWYENGQRYSQRNFKHGREHGFQKAWYPDGHVLSLKNFRDGVPEGDFFEWYNSGKISSFIRYKNGEEVLARTWTGGKKPFYNYVWRNKERVGLLGDRYCSKIR